MNHENELLKHTKHFIMENGVNYSHAREFNIFTLLRELHDEVNLHSAFLADLLNPDGTHNCKTTFLELFLEQVGVPVRPSSVHTVRHEFHNMDIFLVTDSGCIIIENKIYAGDQPHQLQRYYNYAKSQGYSSIYVVYLTLYGDSPPKQSQGNINPEFLYPISYADDVATWIGSCTHQIHEHAHIREILIQYQQVLTQLTGQYYGEHLMDILTQLSDLQTFEAAIAIQQALVQKKIDTQYMFWQELELYLKTADLPLQHSSSNYNRKKIAKFYRLDKGTNSYGILFKFEYPELQSKVGFYIMLEKDFCYGFVGLNKDGNRIKVEGNSNFEHFREILNQLDVLRDESTWFLGHKLPKQPLEFRQFSSPQTMQLINEQERRKYIENLVDEIQVTVNEFLAKAA